MINLLKINDMAYLSFAVITSFNSPVAKLRLSEPTSRVGAIKYTNKSEIENPTSDIKISEIEHPKSEIKIS